MSEKEILMQLISDFQEKPSEGHVLIRRENSIPLYSEKIITITGVRRSGKTTCMMQLIEDLQKKISRNKIIFINFEDERFTTQPSLFESFLEAWHELFPNEVIQQHWFFFDEIQNIQSWDKFVRRFYDNFSKHIFLSGSNSQMLSSELSTALRGRSVSYEILPFSFPETLRFLKTPPSQSSRSQLLRKKAMQNYLHTGGFPEIVKATTQIEYGKILQEYYYVMLYKDLIDRFQIKSPHLLKYFIRRLVESIGKPFSVHKIYNELKSQGYAVTKGALYEWLDHLQAIRLVYPCFKQVKSVLKQELGEKKFYLVDHGLMQQITMLGLEGSVFENFVFMELLKQNRKPTFWKDTLECDFWLENESIAIQACLKLKNPLTLERELKGLENVAAKLSPKKLIILTLEDRGKWKSGSKTVEAIPAHEFFLAGSIGN